MLYMLVCDEGDIIPIGSYRPLTHDDGLIPVEASLGSYWRIDSVVIKPAIDPKGNIVTPAEETNEFRLFMSEGEYHSYSIVQSVREDYQNYDNLSDDTEEIPIVNNLDAIRYMTDQAYFVQFETTEELMDFLKKYCEAPYILGDQYENGSWGGDQTIAYIVVDTIKMNLDS